MLLSGKTICTSNNLYSIVFSNGSELQTQGGGTRTDGGMQDELSRLATVEDETQLLIRHGLPDADAALLRHSLEDLAEGPPRRQRYDLRGRCERGRVSRAWLRQEADAVWWQPRRHQHVGGRGTVCT